VSPNLGQRCEVAIASTASRARESSSALIAASQLSTQPQETVPATLTASW
jgi:hypothetical protein